MNAVTLTGKQRQQLEEATLKAFDYQSLKRGVLFELNLQLDQMVTIPDTFTNQVSQLFDWAERQSQVRQLVTALRKCNHANTFLEAAEEKIFGGADVAPTAREAFIAASQSVESQVKGDPSLQALIVGIPGLPYDVGGQDERWWRAKAAVARVESPDGIPCASGFLVGPDLLLTNDHVRMDARFDANPKAVLIRFGYSRTDAVAGYGQAVGLDEHWLLASSPVEELDYCLVRLRSRVGEQPVGRDVRAPKRSWLIPSADAAKIGDIITVLGHPKGETLMQAAGVIKNSGADGWLDYSAHTLPGSSGSPVLNARFELVGLHSREGTTVSNRGASLAAIIKHIEIDKPSIRKLLVTIPS